jgi:hypothetical protein
MTAPQIVQVASRDQLRRKMSDYAAKGYATVHDGGDTVPLSRKKPFNWVLAIICLFIPIIGWIALVMMIIAGQRGHQVVELHLASA